MKHKVLISICIGGFGLSHLGNEMIMDLKGVDRWIATSMPRHDKDLIAVVEELGLKAASGEHADLRIVEIEGSRYRIEQYGGAEKLITPDDDDCFVVIKEDG